MSVDDLRRPEHTATYNCSTFCVLLGHLWLDVYLIVMMWRTYKVVSRRGLLETNTRRASDQHNHLAEKGIQHLVRTGWFMKLIGPDNLERLTRMHFKAIIDLSQFRLRTRGI